MGEESRVPEQSRQRQGLLALLEKVKRMRPAKVQEDEERAPLAEEEANLRIIDATIRLKALLGELNGERGYVKYICIYTYCQPF